ncbi:MAG: molybdopterin-guanine dinucleotide biosynthesis protein B [Candidatus Cloacimonetes bacterium]|nr:molybdopterin-guanine dinucleotide biosynthesis protein B [Candidatus Cloacimonadota bacterium]MCF7814487.1 molybdopterin-guanine dinucleotide biosynthesis protein B [Candidatus Cloacimonadota bacterium]MCF7867879.1 molybdopterin-guanine dinucleotide biosynthesis protein B [Candidatus Cloacimonadota bacterium]MCF7883698.1 molybdopterin-guanine dinucleotide biosynthesis protein B [Candidatus Cloacimonadota bacterium]
MKVVSVAGYHHTGKTTVVVNLIKELRRRGYTVSSIKDIHSEKFSMEKIGSNSWKHWEASQNVVIARGLTETYQVWHQQLSLQQMLSKLNTDWVVVEGMRSEPLPRIICAENKQQLDELVDGTVLAISGKYANDHVFHDDLHVFKADKDIQELTDLVERKVFEVLPLPKQECCGECGFSCREMVENILQGKMQRSDCKVDNNVAIKVEIGDEQLDLVPYVQNTFKDIIEAYLQNLKGYKKGKKIKIEINN